MALRDGSIFVEADQSVDPSDRTGMFFLDVGMNPTPQDRVGAFYVEVELGISIFAPTTQATGRTKVNSASVPAGSKVTIQGQDLTSVHAARTPGANDFNGAAGSAVAVVADMVAAINDGANSFGSIVSGSQGYGGDNAVLALLASAADFPGTAGNSLTLTTNDPTNLTVTAFAGGQSGLGEAVYIAEAISAEYVPKAGAEGLQGDVLQGAALFGWQIQQSTYGFQGGSGGSQGS